MRKLLIIVTAGLLIANLNVSVWIKQKTQSSFHCVKNPITNEDAEDIANKLWNQSIKIDPHFWLDKDIANYERQFNAMIVQQGILTANEVQYVSWSNLKINLAGWYWSKGVFTVSKDGATASGHVTVDADSGETPVQIAAKLTKTETTLNFNYWNGKNIQTNLAELKKIIVNEGILTKVEASEITGVADDGYGFVINSSWIGLGFPTDYIINDNNTATTASNAAGAVKNDGDDATQLANSMQNQNYTLKTNAVRQYADTTAVEQNLRSLLIDAYNYNAIGFEQVILPHVKLQPSNSKIDATVMKDGQTATASVNLVCKHRPHLYYHFANSDLSFYVNLTPALTRRYKTFFADHSIQEDLGYFYNVLDDGGVVDPSIPWYSGPIYIPLQNRLDLNMHGFGKTSSPQQNIALEANTSQASIASFASKLVAQIMHSDGYLSLMVNWHYATNETVSAYHFW